MSKFTEGEWECSYEHVYAGDFIVCKMSYDFAPPPEQIEANMKLIAAAPDLLAACEMFIASWRSGQREKLDVASRMTKAAIAKARGETP